MVSVAWLFVFSKFIELTDTVSYWRGLVLGGNLITALGRDLRPSVLEVVGASFGPFSVKCWWFYLISLMGEITLDITEATSIITLEAAG